MERDGRRKDADADGRGQEWIDAERTPSSMNETPSDGNDTSRCERREGRICWVVMQGRPCMTTHPSAQAGVVVK